MRVIYPGTFDPLTNGHLDIIERASRIFKEVIVAVVKDPSKTCMFTYQERIEIVRKAIKGIKGLKNKVKVEGFQGLVVDYARKKGIKIILRGLRMISDFEYELQMALTNRNIAGDIETVFLMPHPKFSYVSSRLIKEAVLLGGDLKELLPPSARNYLKKKIKATKSDFR